MGQSVSKIAVFQPFFKLSRVIKLDRFLSKLPHQCPIEGKILSE
jgi:hypothetical protein